jgi:hypothetical protein
VSERNLSRRLSTSIVDALKAHGHILVARGGATALARELEDKMSDDIETIAPRLEPWGLVDGEVTTTFGADEVDDQVEELVATLTSTLMEPEHVEDVFAEDNVIKRDVFRVMRDALLGPRRGLVYDDDGPVQVRLDTLGYIASTVGKRAVVRVLREALARAAQSAGGKLTGYDPETREATFSITGNDPDARLELEEAVADELSDLVETHVVSLPMVERRIELSRKIEPGSRGSLRQRIDAVAAKTLRQGGCAASWELEGDRTLKIKVTPLSEQDAIEVDSHVSALAREIASVLGEVAAGAGAADRPAAPAHDASTRKASATSRKRADDEDEDDLDDDDEDDLDDDDEDDLDDDDEDDLDDDDEDDLDDDDEEEPAAAKRSPARAKLAKKAAPAAVKKASAPAKKASASAKKASAPAKKPAPPAAKKAAKKTPASSAKAPASPAKKSAAAAPAAKKPSAKKR